MCTSHKPEQITTSCRPAITRHYVHMCKRKWTGLQKTAVLMEAWPFSKVLRME